MLLFVARRAVSALLTLLAMSVLVFGLARLSGDPRYLMLDEYANRADFEALGRYLGLDRPLHEQYTRFLGQVVTGDLGTSPQVHQPVAQLIAERFPATLQLAGTAFVLTIVISTLLGVLTAINRGTWLDRVGKVAALLGQSVPSFWLGIVLIFVVSVTLGLLPTAGRGDWKNLILPAFTLSVYSTGALTLLLRGAMLDTLDAEYVKLARAKGVTQRRIFWVHCLRNAALVPFTYAGIVLGHFLTGSIVVETVFAWPGVGQLALQAVQTRDYQLLQGVVLVFAMIYIGVAFLVDLVYGLLDPRVSA
jgi:peptide/nickel transport system permease protein